MKVKEIMTRDPTTCTPDTTAAAAASLMSNSDCGILPVVDHGVLIGVVTDRDLFLALGARNTRASLMQVGSIAASPVATCTPEDDIHDALAAMKQAHVRRLPVVGFGRAVLGILSIDDVVHAASADRAVRPRELVDILDAIMAHHAPVPTIVTAQ